MRTDAEAGFATADFDDSAGSFVPEDARRRDEAVMDFFDVGRANAADSDFDEEFVWADCRNRDVFKAEVVCAAINNGAHGFRDVEHQNDFTENVRKGTKK